MMTDKLSWNEKKLPKKSKINLTRWPGNLSPLWFLSDILRLMRAASMPSGRTICICQIKLSSCMHRNT